ncbi:hypothetical protein [Opitutus sp. GAS368]|uniref:hypothetical protein n=1 Tax=Opitutus sp. GAS368 TaxID=1882749 RepID=UPI00087CDB54|nr:hypothetical protein [Opitutus sp. GAS368]SDR73500.1 hypothetical protein SAMN05444173_0657 [Opitutus sp. GAS368]
MKSYLLLVMATLTLGLAGCSSPVRPAGDFHLGDAPEPVEAALGRPNHRQQRVGTGGPETVWIYTHYHLSPPTATGWSEVLVAGVHDQNDAEIRKPVTREVYHKEVERDMLVVFIGGRVRYVEYQTR